METTHQQAPDMPTHTSVGVQTDPLPPPPPPPCLAPCCQTPKSNTPGKQAPKTSTPRKQASKSSTLSRQDPPQSSLSSILTEPMVDMDCSFFSDMSLEGDDRQDESYLPSESDNSDSEDDGQEEVSPLKCDKLLVFDQQLDILFQKCQGDGMCSAPVDNITKSFRGSMITVTGTCNNHHTFVWRSQPIVNRMPLGNLFLAASTLYTGNTYTTLSEISNCLRLKIFCERDFYYIQKKWLLPSINVMWTQHQEQLLSGMRLIYVVLSGNKDHYYML